LEKIKGNKNQAILHVWKEQQKEKGDEGSEETWPSMQRTAVATRW